MGADMEAISVGAPSGLRNHMKSFHAKGAAESMRMEVENMPAEKATDTKNSEQLVAGTVGVQTTIEDGWNYDDIVANDETDEKKTRRKRQKMIKKRITRRMTTKRLVPVEKRIEKRGKKSRHQVERKNRKNKIRRRSWSRQEQWRRKTTRRRRRLTIRRPRRIAS